ncbi:MAG: hypothetical protein ABJF01_22780 [bacterium]
MIVSFRSADTEALAAGRKTRRFATIESVARCTLRQLEIAGRLDDQRVPPGNRLEALEGERAGQHGIRIMGSCVPSITLSREHISMFTDPYATRRIAVAAPFAAIAAAICTVMLAAPNEARATAADCTAAKAAATLQSTTPFHATYVVTATQPGSFPTEHHEEIWVGNTMYTLLKDGRWMNAPVRQNPMQGFTGPIPGFSDCRPVPTASIGGEMATGYDVKMESGRRAKIYISPKSGLPVRDLVDQDILLVTLDFNYTNVKAPR